jgi:hypothetical protein
MRFALVFLLAAASGQAQMSRYKQIDFNWTYKPNLPACTRKLISCYSGFTLTWNVAGWVLATPSVLTPTVRSYAYFPPDGVPYGYHTFALVTNGYDENGQAVESAPATVTLEVKTPPPSSPTALTGVFQ